MIAAIYFQHPEDNGRSLSLIEEHCNSHSKLTLTLLSPKSHINRPIYQSGVVWESLSLTAVHYRQFLFCVSKPNNGGELLMRRPEWFMCMLYWDETRIHWMSDSQDDVFQHQLIASSYWCPILSLSAKKIIKQKQRRKDRLTLRKIDQYVPNKWCLVYNTNLSCLGTAHPDKYKSLCYMTIHSFLPFSAAVFIGRLLWCTEGSEWQAHLYCSRMLGRLTRLDS